jgi:hypothetical protein
VVSCTSSPSLIIPHRPGRLSLTRCRPVKEHTELEEELHEKAHIDYDRVAIVPNPSVAALYEDALVYETGSAITSTGALTAYSGAKTGRSPLDKRIVKEPSSENDIWWGPVNKPMTPDVSFHFALNSFVLSVEQHETKLHCYFFGITFLGQSVVSIAKSPIHFLHVTCHYHPTQTCSIARLHFFSNHGMSLSRLTCHSPTPHFRRGASRCAIMS